jgi:hypothetical protein
VHVVDGENSNHNTSQQELGGEKQISVLATGILHAFERFARNY